eukprot:CAMPEP_0172379692 /NCGR_PEP_ID=MMETSP1060-20121228/70062_1 /TAXON_ID=37318 /ORGANISM="Pseudo-nitzschia pungens, Strain cf. cingulata" /LENGTH=452 /DNA_ID=CAMNT_0013107437 /DNA_START=92 /DNA_END=1451 /DNA_ORIENTATION=-
MFSSWSVTATATATTDESFLFPQQRHRQTDETRVPQPQRIIHDPLANSRRDSRRRRLRRRRRFRYRKEAKCLVLVLLILLGVVYLATAIRIIAELAITEAVAGINGANSGPTSATESIPAHHMLDYRILPVAKLFGFIASFVTIVYGIARVRGRCHRSPLLTTAVQSPIALFSDLDIRDSSRANPSHDARLVRPDQTRRERSRTGDSQATTPELPWTSRNGNIASSAASMTVAESLEIFNRERAARGESTVSAESIAAYERFLRDLVFSVAFADSSASPSDAAAAAARNHGRNNNPVTKEQLDEICPEWAMSFPRSGSATHEKSFRDSAHSCCDDNYCLSNQTECGICLDSYDEELSGQTIRGGGGGGDSGDNVETSKGASGGYTMAVHTVEPYPAATSSTVVASIHGSWNGRRIVRRASNRFFSPTKLRADPTIPKIPAAPTTAVTGANIY